jgi:hypothetical protein
MRPKTHDRNSLAEGVPGRRFCITDPYAVAERTREVRSSQKPAAGESDRENLESYRLSKFLTAVHHAVCLCDGLTRVASVGDF